MLIWADGFGHYGNTDYFRGSGFYIYRTNYDASPLRIGTGGAARTGGYYWQCNGMQYDNWYGGRMFGGNQPIIGIGAAFLFPGLPGNTGFCLFMMCGNGRDDFQVSLLINPDGSLEVRQGNGGTYLGGSDPGTITPGAYQYVEMKTFVDNVNGSVEVRVNNTQKILITGVDTDTLNIGHINGFMIGRNGWNAGGSPCEGVADLVVWDATGAFNNDFIGDIRCRTFLPGTDGPLQDWTATGSPAYGEIDNVPYDAAKNIAAANVGDISNFGKVALPINTAYVAGINLFTVANKTDAGTCEITPQIVGSDGTSVADGAVISPGTGTAYYNAIFETDPATGLQFLPAGFDSALMQVERTA